MNCALCGTAIDIDPADDMQPPGGKSYCGKCAPLVRPGMYAVPGNISYKALDLLASFKELPPSVRNRLVLCFGPRTWVDIRKEVESRTLMQVAGQVPGLPSGAVAQLSGYYCYLVRDYGPGALFIRLDPPPSQEKMPA